MAGRRGCHLRGGAHGGAGRAGGGGGGRQGAAAQGPLAPLPQHDAGRRFGGARAAGGEQEEGGAEQAEEQVQERRATLAVRIALPGGSGGWRRPLRLLDVHRGTARGCPAGRLPAQPQPLPSPRAARARGPPWHHRLLPRSLPSSVVQHPHAVSRPRLPLCPLPCQDYFRDFNQEDLRGLLPMLLDPRDDPALKVPPCGRRLEDEQQQQRRHAQAKAAAEAARAAAVAAATRGGSEWDTGAVDSRPSGGLDGSPDAEVCARVCVWGGAVFSAGQEGGGLCVQAAPWRCTPAWLCCRGAEPCLSRLAAQPEAPCLACLPHDCPALHPPPSPDCLPWCATPPCPQRRSSRLVSRHCKEEELRRQEHLEAQAAAAATVAEQAEAAAAAAAARAMAVVPTTSSGAPAGQLLDVLPEQRLAMLVQQVGRRGWGLASCARGGAFDGVDRLCACAHLSVPPLAPKSTAQPFP